MPATGGDSASVPGSRYGLGIFFIPLSCGGGYWSHEGDVPGYNTIGAVSSDGRTTPVLSLDSNVDDPELAAEYRLVDHVDAATDTRPAKADRARHHPRPQPTRPAAHLLFRQQGQMCRPAAATIYARQGRPASHTALPHAATNVSIPVLARSWHERPPNAHHAVADAGVGQASSLAIRSR